MRLSPGSSVLLLLVGSIVRFVGASDHRDGGESSSSTAATLEILSDGSAGSVAAGLLRDNDSDTSAAAADDEANVTRQAAATVDHGKALLDWVRSNRGGFVHPAISIVSSAPEGTNSSDAAPTWSYGMFATDDIAKGETLLEIPKSFVLRPGLPQRGDRVMVKFAPGPEDDEDEGGDSPCVVLGTDPADGTYRVLCDNEEDESEEYTDIDADFVTHEDAQVSCALVRLLAREMKLGDRSDYAPYVNYLNALPTSNVPSAWSASGQQLLHAVLGHDETPEFVDEDSEIASVLPPADPFGLSEADGPKRCNEGLQSSREKKAYFMVMQRSWDHLLVPVFDMMSHRNGRWLNTDNVPFLDNFEDDDEVKAIKVFATRAIRKGEELSTSYNMCSDCVGRSHSGYGTPELLRDYGFVEDYPRRFDFEFDTGRVSFDIDYEFDETTGELKDELVVTWLNGPPDVPTIQDLYDQVDRLILHNETTLSDPFLTVPSHELSLIRQYVDALIVAMTNAIATAQGSGDAISSFALRYPELAMPQPETWVETRPKTCDWSKHFHYGDWDNVAQYTTPYQEMEFDINPYIGSNGGDVCFDLDTVVQMCTSYRPQYHEMMVHHPARFLSSIERVVFVGGGDSMLLHEALKYPSLQKVVGLELDQTVVRASFEHFGSQPHWDNEKVEWWFGDATKSLLVLPNEYFGSFDLVLVDLSETVMSLSVTTELDVMEALSLLVKPGGIMVQNEYEHFFAFLKLFRNSMTIHYDGVPVVCSQSMILASNGVDFLRGSYTDHGVPHLFDLLDEPNVQHEIVRDYQTNTTNPHHCEKYKDLSQTIAQYAVPGVALILEVESVKVDLSACDDLNILITRALEDQGLELTASVTSQYERGCKLAFVMQEGYVIGRSVPDAEYLGFDLHFWSDFHKQDLIRRELVQAVGDGAKGAPSSSAYRIVTVNGMLSSLDRDRVSQTVGPHLEDFCDKKLPSATEAFPPSHTKLESTDRMDEALLESFSILDRDASDYNVAVLCGSVDAECRSLDIMKKKSSVKSVLAIPTCASIIHGMDELNTTAMERMKDCETEVKSRLAQHGRKIRALVVDPTASHQLAQVMARVLQRKYYKDEFLTKDFFVQATVPDGATWRKAFVDRFRKGIFGVDPVFRSEVVFETHDTRGTNFSVILASSGGVTFPDAISRFADRLEKATGYTSLIHDVRSGAFPYTEDFKAHAIFSYDSYDRTDQRKQWQDQKPVGLQTLVQMTYQPVDDVPISCSHLAASFASIFSAVIPGLVSDQISTLEKSVGGGCVLVYLWEGGTSAVTLDGTENAVLNVFLDGNGHDDVRGLKRREDNLEARLLDLLGEGASSVLVDRFPRGSGRTTHYGAADRIPHWF